MSRTNSYNSSGSSFVKKPGLTSEDSFQETPQTKQSAGKPIVAEAPRRAWYLQLFPKSWPIRLFLATVVLETIIDLAVQGDLYTRLSAISDRESNPEDPSTQIRRTIVYLALFAFAHVFQLALAIEAVWQQNTLQFIFLIIFNLLFFVYSLIQSTEIRKLGADSQSGITSVPVTSLTIISHVVIGISELAFIGLGWQIWKEFGWKVYKFLGADRNIKRIYMHYQIFLSLLRFDFFFSIGFSGQLIAFVLGSDSDRAEYFLTIGALPLGCLILVGGHVAARYENKWMMFGFMIGCVCATVYFTFKLFRIYGIIGEPYKNGTHSLTTFAAVSLLFLILTFVWGCIVMHNFGRGLKEQMSKKHVAGHRRRGTSMTLDNKNFPMTSNPNRMSIEKSLGFPNNSNWFRRALADENFQYFLLSLFWLLNKPIGFALIPFWTFSTFHVATFARSTLIPKFFPPVPNQNGSGTTNPPISKAIQLFIKKYYDPCMRAVSYVEIAIFVRALVGVLIRRNPLLMPIGYGLFLRSRYFQSPFTREAFKNIDAAILQALSNPQVGGSVPQAPTYYTTFKTYLGRLVAPPRATPVPAGATADPSAAQSSGTAANAKAE
ncbi:hypothetical protein FRC17_002716 [Serendipita sp. 399]|nr:hypothetical protein FRC17_002716 [Serendipita sp. 399]